MAKKTKNIRTRIAPSPTGFLHIGLARTALFNYLFAKQNEGAFVLRIEDTDKERSTKESEKDIIDNLKWLGLEWDEGPEIKGEYEPYRQTQRLHIYRKYLEKLLKDGKAYHCFCSEEELEAQRQYHMSIGQAPKYSGKCSKLDAKTVEKNIEEGKTSVIRFRVGAKKISFTDIIRGKLDFDGELIGDIVIAKGLDEPLYNLAVAVDDHEMKITHVIRGEEHIANTPKQIALQEALGFDKLEYAHLPLILAPDKTKLSKRHGAISVSEFREEGYLPETLVNFMAFLGWNPGDEREIFSLQNLIKEFSFERVQKGGAIFNGKRLDYLNGFYLRQKSLEKLTFLCIPYLIKSGLMKENGGDMDDFGSLQGERLELFKKTKYIVKETGEGISVEVLMKIVSIYQERLKKLSEIPELTEFFFKSKLDYDRELIKWKDMDEDEIGNSLDILYKKLSSIKDADWNKDMIESSLLVEAEKIGDRGKLLWPFRVSLTNKKNSAGPFEIAEILGKKKTLQRIEEARQLY